MCRFTLVGEFDAGSKTGPARHSPRKNGEIFDGHPSITG